MIEEEWWVMVGDDPNRELDGPFVTIDQALEFIHRQDDAARLVRFRGPA